MSMVVERDDEVVLVPISRRLLQQKAWERFLAADGGGSAQLLGRLLRAQGYALAGAVEQDVRHGPRETDLAGTAGWRAS